MKQLVEVNLTKKAARNWEPPKIYFGEKMTIALRYFQDVSAGEEIATYLKNVTLKAAVGRVDARPSGGSFALKVGDSPIAPSNTSAAIPYDARPVDLAAALNAVPASGPYGQARVVETNGSWLVFFGNQSQLVPLTVVDNALWPVSFGRVGAWQVDGKWVHELRLTQAPVAFTSQVEQTLPAIPQIKRIVEGGCDPANITCWNEMQELYIPPDFLGAFVLRFGYARTPELSREYYFTDIEKAMQELGKGWFKVSLGRSDHLTIEFVGEAGKMPQPLLAVEITQAPPGDDTFTINYDTAELAALLRDQDEVELPLEVRINGEDEHGISGEVCALSLPVTLCRAVILPQMESLPMIDFVRPHSPQSYRPFGENNLLVGQLYYTELCGNGVVDTFTITHGLGTEAVIISIRENEAGGRQLTSGVDFIATIDSANDITITAIIATPAEDSWAVMVIGAANTAIWANGLTVTVPQVVAGGGYPALTAFFDNMNQRVETLEQILPNISVGDKDPGSGVIEIPIATITEVLFYRGAEIKIEKDGEIPKLPTKAPFMLPAVHAVLSPPPPLPEELPDPEETTPGSMWKNNTGETVIIPGATGIRTAFVEPNGLVGCDGRMLYAATQDAGTTSYFPKAYERELFMFYVSEKMLASRTLHLTFAVQTALINATSRASWLMEIQAGAAPQDVNPATTGPNLQNIIWNATPLLRERLILSQELLTHTFGVRIANSLQGMKCDVQNYGLWTANNAAAPTGPAFALRARLINYDTENSIPDARGWTLLKLAAPKAANDKNDTSGASADGKLSAFIM